MRWPQVRYALVHDTGSCDFLEHFIAKQISLHFRRQTSSLLQAIQVVCELLAFAVAPDPHMNQPACHGIEVVLQHGSLSLPVESKPES